MPILTLKCNSTVNKKNYRCNGFLQQIQDKSERLSTRTKSNYSVCPQLHLYLLVNKLQINTKKRGVYRLTLQALNDFLYYERLLPSESLPWNK